jgi:predicted HD phosphohydrolase
VTGVEVIAGLFAGPGARAYLGEEVTIGVHMRQAAVRRWDDEAKDPVVTPPPFSHFEALLGGLVRS